MRGHDESLYVRIGVGRLGHGTCGEGPRRFGVTGDWRGYAYAPLEEILRRQHFVENIQVLVQQLRARVTHEFAKRGFQRGDVTVPNAFAHHF